MTEHLMSEHLMLSEIAGHLQGNLARRRWLDCFVAAGLGACAALAAARAAGYAAPRSGADDDAAPAVGPAAAASHDGDACGLVLSLGISVLDYSVVLDAFPKPDSKQVAEKQVAGGGGNAANTSVCVSRLGVGAALMSKVGDDPAGLTLLKQLNEEGVRCEGTVQVAAADGSDGSTVTCFVLVAGDTRTIVSMPYSQRVSDLDPSWAEAQLRPLLDRSSVSMLQLDGRHPDAGARCAALARENHVPVCELKYKCQNFSAEEMENCP